MNAPNSLLPRRWAMGVLGIGFLACLGLNFPGQLSYDSVAQLHDGRLGVYNGWHPPVMAFLLGIADSVVPGTGIFVACDMVLFFGSAALLLWMEAYPRWGAAIVAALLTLTPQVLLYQGIVWKDVLFADSAIAGFVLIVFAAARWPNAILRHLCLWTGLVLLVLAALARQNGAVALAFGITAIGVTAAARARRRRLRAFTIYASAALVAATLLDTSANLALQARVPGESGTVAQLRLLEFYDLIGALKDTPDLKLDHITQANPKLAGLMRRDGVRLYTPERNDTLVGSPDLQRALAATPPSLIFAQWRDLVLHHPLQYLEVRERVFAWVFLTPGGERCYPVYVGVGGLPATLRELHLSARQRPQDVWLKAYGESFVGTPVFSHLTFALLAIGEIFFLVRRRSPADLVLAFLPGAALAFAASFFVISIACDYRYLLFLDLSALITGLYLATTRSQNGRKIGAGSTAGAAPQDSVRPAAAERLHRNANKSED